MSSLFSQYHDGLRLAVDYLPPCPQCSQRLPQYWRFPSLDWARHSGGVHIGPCSASCELARQSPIIPYAAVPAGLMKADLAAATRAIHLDARRQAANWWKMRRLDGDAQKLAWFREQGLTEEMEATK